MMKIEEATKHLLNELPKMDKMTQTAIRTILSDLDIKTRKLTLEKTFDDLPNEIWRFLEGYDGHYQISNKGRIQSNYSGKWRLLKTWFSTKDINESYWKVRLSMNGKSKFIAVHILVAKTFIPNPEKKPEVNHINGDKLDCSVDNLEWVTSSENIKHAYHTGLRKIKIGTENPRSQLTEEQVRYIRQNYKPHDKKFGMFAMAEKFNVNAAIIYNVVSGRSYKNIE